MCIEYRLTAKVQSVSGLFATYLFTTHTLSPPDIFATYRLPDIFATWILRQNNRHVKKVISYFLYYFIYLKIFRGKGANEKQTSIFQWHCHMAMWRWDWEGD